MISVSQAYKEAINSNERKSYVIAKYGLYDKNAKGSINKVESNSKSFSNINKTYNEIKDTNYNYISCEPNRVLLNNNFYFLNNKERPNTNENLAYWSSILSDENGYFTTKEESTISTNGNTILIEEGVVSLNTIYLTNNNLSINGNTIIYEEQSNSTGGTISNPSITYTFDKSLKFTEITLYFQEVCEEFKVNYYIDNTLIATRHIKNNKDLIVTTQETTMANEIYFNKLKIEFIKTYYPNRYIKLNEIDFGVLQTFSDSQIIDYDIIDELSIDSSELSSNSLNLTIDNTNGEFDVLNPKNKLATLQERQEITMYHYLKVGTRYQELPLGTFLIKEFKVRNQSLMLEAYDDTYFMNDTYYGSKFYVDEDIVNILEDLFSYFNYTNYVIDDELKGITLSGYIPNVEFREALRLIAEAGQCVISKTRFGITYIYKTYDPVSKVFTRKVIDKEKPSKNLFNNIVGILEYNYTNVVENYEIYNSTLKSGEYTIIFKEFPIKQDTLVKSDNTNTNYEITSVSAISCKVKVTNETQVILNATLVKPTSTLKTIKKDEYQMQQQDYVIEKIDNTLITTQYESVGKWKLGRGEIKYNFNTMTIPYIEVGDTCQYQTRFGTTNTFIPTRLEFTKSITQNIEGE